MEKSGAGGGWSWRDRDQVKGKREKLRKGLVHTQAAQTRNYLSGPGCSSLFADPLCSLQSPSSAGDKISKPQGIYRQPAQGGSGGGRRK